jgi:hypothetical protein
MKRDLHSEISRLLSLSALSALRTLSPSLARVSLAVAGQLSTAALTPANLTTLAHFSVSSAISWPNSAGVTASGALAMSANRARISGSARPALIVLLSNATIPAGVSLGAPMPTVSWHYSKAAGGM